MRMKTYTDYLVFNTRSRIEFVRITDQVNDVIERSGIRDGIVLVNPMHITAAVIVNDDENGLKRDFIRVLQKLIPYDDNYEHNVGEDNAAAHIWRQFMGHQVVMPVRNGRLELGRWEQLFYCEFDGQRTKRVLVKVIGE
ncbi:MAG: secondary thiamine-phosphate synthase enzyme YjbQ [Candidatus Bilamarchaeaceae archaeon]